MSEKLRFATDATIITRLGKELVAKQETALIELVKNAFDADATCVDVIFADDFITNELLVVDNGSGMTREELVHGFLRIGSTLKIDSPKSAGFDRQRAGSKGIGRFAAQRLGDRLTLTTRASSSSHGMRLNVDWREFAPGKDLAGIDVTLEDVADCPVGTTLRIEGLRDRWTDAQVKRCWRGVIALQQPFPVAPIEGSSSVDPGFSVRFKRKDMLFSDESVVADLQTEILDHLHAVIELKVDASGSAKWSLTKNRFGEPRDWQAIHHEHTSSADPPPYGVLRNVWMKSYYVILQPDLLPSLVFTRVRDVLAEFGGVRLYRNGFRVVPYGDPDNDWLRLDETYAKRSLLIPVANRNFFGIVEVNDASGTLFEEHTSREGLIETPAFAELKNLASSVLLTAATRISEDRGRKVRAGRRNEAPTVPSENPLSEISDAIKAVQDAAERAAESGTPDSARIAEQARDAAQLLERKSSEFAAKQATLVDETNMLRFLATLGMTSAEFNHETGMTFDAFRLDFARIFEVAAAAAANDKSFSAQAERASRMLERLDTLTSYLNALASARSARGMNPVSLTRALDDFRRGMSLQANSQGIVLEVNAPPYDPLFTRPMHQAEIASILLNLYTNAVKAIKRRGADRRIMVSADRIATEGALRIRFCDTGDGIAVENRERVFDAFYTTSVAPSSNSTDLDHATGTGLGLWIVHQIVNNAGGRIQVLDGEEPYATCVEVELSAEQEDGQS